jgi:hypothetical protein
MFDRFRQRPDAIRCNQQIDCQSLRAGRPTRPVADNKNLSGVDGVTKEIDDASFILGWRTAES